MSKCPICKTRVPEPHQVSDSEQYACPNCGRFQISGSALACIERLNTKARAALSFGIWQNQNPERIYGVYTSHLDAAESGELPDVSEQLDRLILYFGTKQSSPGTFIDENIGNLRAKLGAIDIETEMLIVSEASRQGLVDMSRNTMQNWGARLTFSGWRRFHEIQGGAVLSRKAFIAMPFGIPSITTVVDNYFRPAVVETGFVLARLDDEPQAGLIDNRMRVEIRLSRFLIAELTHRNCGAYWEAGFAEGLGKPVIYTCEKSFFEDKVKGGSHFDTNHCTTVLWEEDKPDDAAKQLMDTIRATLPFEARMPKDPS